MSTKALHEALKHLEDTRGADHPVYVEARAELEAIEKAAGEVASGYLGTVPYRDEAQEAVDLLERIAAQRSGGTTGAKDAGASGEGLSGQEKAT